MVEMCLIAPAVVTLAAGGGQVGIIAYGAASVESAARAAARVGSEYPNKSLDFKTTLNTTTYTCGQTPTDSLTENSICAAARSSAGLLSGSALTVTITYASSISTAPPPRDVMLAGNSCPGGALETGTVSNLPSGTVASISSPAQSSASTVLTDSSGNYSICLNAPNNSQGNQTSSLTATAVDGAGCTYSTSTSVTIATDKTVTPSPANMTLPTTGVCPTPVTTPTPTSGTQSFTTGTMPPDPSTPTCSTSIPDTSYVQVSVSYNAPVFVPFVSKYLESSPNSGIRTVTATQRMQVEPCNITQGG
jgi:Flp pilus assembly protein TadG